MPAKIALLVATSVFAAAPLGGLLAQTKPAPNIADWCGKALELLGRRGDPFQKAAIYERMRAEGCLGRNPAPSAQAAPPAQPKPPPISLACNGQFAPDEGQPAFDQAFAITINEPEKQLRLALPGQPPGVLKLTGTDSSIFEFESSQKVAGSEQALIVGIINRMDGVALVGFYGDYKGLLHGRCDRITQKF